MFSPTAFQQFQNPYEDAVVQRTISDAMDADAMRNTVDRARQVSSGHLVVNVTFDGRRKN